MEQSLHTSNLCVGSVIYYDSRAIIWVWLGETTSAAAWVACRVLSFVLGLLSLCSFCSIASVAQHASSCLILCYLYSCVVCGVLCARSHREHNGAIPIPLKLHSENTIIPSQLPLRFSLRTWLRLPRNARHKLFKFLLLFNKYECIYGTTYKYIHTYIHTYTRLKKH